MGCDKGVVVEKSQGVHQVQQAMPTGGKMVDPKHGEETWFAIGSMTGVKGVAANGVAQAHFFQDGTFGHAIQLNIKPAEDGYFYEGWLTKGGKTISTGHLVNKLGDSRHFLTFIGDDDLRDMLKVIITLEKDDGNPAPAQHVAEGTMKVTER